MDLGLGGRVAIVTGVSRGIGEGAARACAGEGADLFLVARSAADLEKRIEAAMAKSNLSRDDARGETLAL